MMLMFKELHRIFLLPISRTSIRITATSRLFDADWYLSKIEEGRKCYSGEIEKLYHVVCEEFEKKAKRVHNALEIYKKSI